MKNIDRTSKNNYIKLFIILYFLAFLFLCLLEPCCVKRKIFPYGIVMVPYYIIVLTSAFILTDVLQNNFCNLKNEKEKSPNKFKIKRR